MQTLIRSCVEDAAAGLGLHLLHMSEGPFSHDAGHLINLHYRAMSICQEVALVKVNNSVKFDKKKPELC